MSHSQGKYAELTVVYSKKICDYCESLHTTMKPVINPVKTSLTTLIFIS